MLVGLAFGRAPKPQNPISDAKKLIKCSSFSAVPFKRQKMQRKYLVAAIKYNIKNNISQIHFRQPFLAMKYSTKLVLSFNL